MIADDMRFEGFDAASWINLLSLFTRGARHATRAELAGPAPSGNLVIVLDAAQRPCASLVTGRGPVALDAFSGTAPALRGGAAFDPASDHAALCAQHGVVGVIVLQAGAIEELTERAAEPVLAATDYAAQWLALLNVARQLEDEGWLRFWPQRSRVPLPSPVVLRRALDVLLPDDRVLLFALWDGPDLWTACALQRSGGELSALIGPDRLQAWAGPLSGDYRRDQRALQRAVSRALGPVHVGLFAQRERIEQLLADSSPGAWARAFALREVIIDPAPAYVHVAVGADAARAVGRRTSEWLGGLDLLGLIAPAGQYVREHVARVGSISDILGFNPLQALADRLKRK